MSRHNNARLQRLLQQLPAERQALATQSHRVGQAVKANISSPPTLILAGIVGFVVAVREPRCDSAESDQRQTVAARLRHHGLLLLAVMLQRIKRSISAFTTE